MSAVGRKYVWHIVDDNVGGASEKFKGIHRRTPGRFPRGLRRVHHQSLRGRYGHRTGHASAGKIHQHVVWGADYDDEGYVKGVCYVNPNDFSQHSGTAGGEHIGLLYIEIGCLEDGGTYTECGLARSGNACREEVFPAGISVVRLYRGGLPDVCPPPP